MNPLRELEAKYPYMFSGDHIGISVARGWLPMFSALCEEIDKELGADKQGFHWRQVKEKFGSGRFYYQFGRTKQPMRIDLTSPGGVLSFKAQDKPRSAKNEKHEVQTMVGLMISKAEAITSKTCIVCGQGPAKIDISESYLLVLCEEHARVRQSIVAKDIWDSD